MQYSEWKINDRNSNHSITKSFNLLKIAITGADKHNEFVINIYFSFDSTLKGKLMAEIKQTIYNLASKLCDTYTQHTSLAV